MTPQEKYIIQLQKALKTQIGQSDVMKGFVQYQADRCRWAVAWWDTQTTKKLLITRYKGELIPCTAFKTERGVPLLDEKGRLIPDPDKCQGHARAERMLQEIRRRQEQADKGECQFRIEEFTKANYVAVADAYETWLKEVIKPNRKPGTTKGYESYLKIWIRPWFEKHPTPLHEIDLTHLMSFLTHLKTNLAANNPNPNANIGKTASNIISTLHTVFDYAVRTGKLKKMPSFPKLEDYDIHEVEIQYLGKEDQTKVFENLPEIHRPIFEWLTLHFRRPGEACALYKTDYDIIRKAFTIQRALSARKIVNSVKTNWKNPTVHYIPCDEDFIATAERLVNENSESPYIFVNPRARKDGGRYTLESLRNVWYKACDDAKVPRIWVYNGVKHTACTHFMENGGTEAELQKLTGHRNMKSLGRYTKITLERTRKVQQDAKQRAEAAERDRKRKKKLEKDGNVIQLFKSPGSKAEQE